MMKGVNDKHKVYIHRCNCGSHFMCIDYYLDDKEGYFSMHIDTPTLWCRVKHIIKYIFKGGIKFEYWGDIIFREKDIDEFIKFFQEIKEGR